MYKRTIMYVRSLYLLALESLYLILYPTLLVYKVIGLSHRPNRGVYVRCSIEAKCSLTGIGLKRCGLHLRIHGHVNTPYRIRAPQITKEQTRFSERKKAEGNN